MASETEKLLQTEFESFSEHEHQVSQESNIFKSANMEYLDLPSTPHDAQKLSLKGINHPGMRMLRNSFRAHRSSNKAIIFLYGMTGSGKTSTLNHLFNNPDMLKVSDDRSCTRDVVEYVVSMTSEDCKVRNLEIGFIDTPGWGDTDGTIQDAVNLSSIAKFLQQHPLLSSKRHSLYPNIVLIVVSAADKRLGGECSNCAYMLRALSKLHVVDQSRPNVVFVVTNASSVPKGRYKDAKKSKTDQIQVMCRQYLGISSPVVWIENDFVGNELERDMDWTFLFDREKQPLNLFEAMISLFKGSKDDIGLEAVRMCFSGNSSNLLNPQPNLRIPCRTVRSKSMSKEVVLNDQEMNWHLYLMKELKLLINTEVSQKLREYTDSHTDIVRYEQMIPMLTYLQEAGITKLFELKTRKLHEIEFILKPFLINRTDKFILLEVFKVQYKSFLDIVQVVGSGYNTENSTISNLRIFDINTLDCEFDYDVGIYIPKCIDTTLIQNTEITCKENEQPSHEADTHGTEVVPARMFCFEIIHNLYTFKTNKYLAKIKHNQEIIKSIEQLPTSALESNNTVNPAYLDFFRLYGNLEIHSAVVSGKISGLVPIYSSRNKTIIEHQVCAIVESKMTAIKDNPQNDIFFEFNVDNVPLEFSGGDQSHYCPTLDQLSNEKWNAWVASILCNPIFNHESYGLSPIYNLVKTIDFGKGKEMQIAYDMVYSKRIHRSVNPFYSISFSNEISNGEETDGKYEKLEEALSRSEAVRIVKPRVNYSNKQDECFPGNASVVLKGGERVRMDELKIGDYVLSIHPTTGKPVYSRVYLWAHRDPHITATFLHITHPHGHLHISANHLILSGDKRRPVPADQLQVGDSIHFLSPCLSHEQQQQLNGKEEEEERRESHTFISVPVLHIQTCTQVGYYAPFTNNGLIVVDGIAASVYSHISTHSQSDSSSSSSRSSSRSRSWLWSGVCHSVTSGLVHQFGMHRVGQCVMAPVRMGCKLGVRSVLSQQMDLNTHIHKYCEWLLELCYPC